MGEIGIFQQDFFFDEGLGECPMHQVDDCPGTNHFTFVFYRLLDGMELIDDGLAILIFTQHQEELDDALTGSIRTEELTTGSGITRRTLIAEILHVAGLTFFPFLQSQVFFLELLVTVDVDFVAEDVTQHRVTEGFFQVGEEIAATEITRSIHGDHVRPNHTVGFTLHSNAFSPDDLEVAVLVHLLRDHLMHEIPGRIIPIDNAVVFRHDQGMDNEVPNPNLVKMIHKTI